MDGPLPRYTGYDVSLRNPRSIVAVLGVCLAVAAGAVWWLWPDPLDAPRPAETQRAQVRRPLVIPAATVQTPTPQLQVTLHTWTGVETTVQLDDAWALNLLPESYWPRLDEVEWPELASVHGVQGLVDARAEVLLRGAGDALDPEEQAALDRVNDVLDQATEEGLLGEERVWDRGTEPLYDPWLAVHSMQIHRIAGFLEFQADGNRHPLDEASWVARRIVAEHPGHPAADYARLQVLEAATFGFFQVSDPGLALDTVREILTQSTDPLVRENALLGMLALQSQDVAAVERERLERTLDAVAAASTEVGSELQLALAGRALELASHRDLASTAQWWERVAALQEGLGVQVVDEVARAQLAGRGLLEPSNAREELVLAMIRCHQASPLASRLVVEARGTEAWRLTTTMAVSRENRAWWSCVSTAERRRVPTETALEVSVRVR